MEHFTLFYAWTLTTIPTDLQRMQHATGMRTLYIYVIPKAIITVWPFFLVREELLLWLAVANMAISWISSFLIQIPLQLKVRENADRVALRKLVSSTWVRTFAMVGHCGVVFYIVLSK